MEGLKQINIDTFWEASPDTLAFSNFTRYLKPIETFIFLVIIVYDSVLRNCKYYIYVYI